MNARIRFSYYLNEYVIAFVFFSIYLVVSILFGGLGSEFDNWVRVFEWTHYRSYFFGRHEWCGYWWLPGYYFPPLFLWLYFFGESTNPWFVARFISCVGSMITLIYIGRWLRDLGVRWEWRFVTLLLVATNGAWFAYSCQSLTEILSASLFTAMLYYLYQFSKSGNRSKLILASGLCLYNVTIRYEPWLFAMVCSLFLLLPRDNLHMVWAKVKKNLMDMVIFAAPSAGFVLFWMVYCGLGKGDPFYFVNQNFANPLIVYSPGYHNLTGVGYIFIRNLFFATGFLWLYPFLRLMKKLHRGVFGRFTVLMLVYSLMILVQLYQGFNVGFLRHWLYFLPLSAIGFALSANEGVDKRFVLFTLTLTVFYSVFGLYNAIQLHRDFIEINPGVFSRW